MTDKVIIAEDDAYIRGTLEGRIARRYDVDVDTVPDGKPLVESVRNGEYAVVLTDNTMLEMSGLMAIIKIREFNQKVPILMLSGDKIEEEAIKVGATYYLNKLKVRGDTLYPILDKYLTPRA